MTCSKCGKRYFIWHRCDEKVIAQYEAQKRWEDNQKIALAREKYKKEVDRSVERMRAEHQEPKRDTSDAGTSFAVGMATNNAMLGGLVGGDFSAALMGDIARDGVIGEAQQDHTVQAGGGDFSGAGASQAYDPPPAQESSPAHDSTPSHDSSSFDSSPSDSSSSSDSPSSSDSGSSGGGE